MAVLQRIIVPFAGHSIGQGFNSQTVERVGTALDVADTGEDKVAPGQAASFRFVMLTSQDSLDKSLNVGAQVDARYGLFSGGAKFDFAESSALNTSSTYILASCVVTNALRSGRDFTPNGLAKPLIAAGDKAGFKAAFGDRYTQALHTGGEFHALVRVTSSDLKHQRTISASLHGEMNGLVTAVSFSAALNVAQTDTHSHTEVDIQVYQTGGVGAQIQIPGTDADKIRAHMNTFAAAAHQNAQAFKAELVTYDTLALPFPADEELEDRRVVLEDCLVRRRGYLSAISDLAYAQLPDAPLIFEDLPSNQELLGLQNAFRTVLNGLMAHARGVANGTIPPALFVAAAEPVLPVFKRRSSGSFASWWKRSSEGDVSLLRDEQILVDAIADEVRSQLAVPIEQATPEAIDRAAGQIESLRIEGENAPAVGSLRALPQMIDAPLSFVRIDNGNLTSLAGLESFSRLRSAVIADGALRDLDALASAAGLEFLFVSGNEIEDLSPLRGLTELDSLWVHGNEIETLEPLRGLGNLNTLVIATERLSAGPVEVLEQLGTNPITDARALAELGQFASCPLTAHDQVRVSVFDSFNNGFDLPTPTLVATGTATRIGASNRFRFTPDSGDAESMMLGALQTYVDLDLFATPGVIYTVWSPTRGTALATARPELPGGLTAQQIVDHYFDGSPLSDEVNHLLGGLPNTLVEISPA